MRPIDAETTYNVLTEYYHHKTETQHEALKEALSRVPTIEPKHGKWIAVFIEYADGSTGQRAECPFCKEQQLTWTNFCPHCGARMENSDE